MSETERKSSKFSLSILITLTFSLALLFAHAEVDKAQWNEGKSMFKSNCASCHNFTGRGGALSAGKYAPDLDPATEDQIYTAMLTGPQNMPKFSDRQLTPEEKKDVIAYIKSVSDGNNNPGGGSYAITDDDGRFTLRLVEGDGSGAVVGKHRVEITSRGAEPDDATDRPKAPRPRTVIPARYSRNSELTFEVPSGGTDKADFALTSP